MVQGEPGAPDLFCGELARARLRWSRKFDRIQDCGLTQGRLQWFIGGQLNVSGEQLHKVIGSARDTRTHTGKILGTSCTLAGRQGTLVTHTLQGHLPSLSPAPAYSTSTLPFLPFMLVVPGLPRHVLERSRGGFCARLLRTSWTSWMTSPRWLTPLWCSSSARHTPSSSLLSDTLWESIPRSQS